MKKIRYYSHGIYKKKAVTNNVFIVFRQKGCSDYEGKNYGWETVLPNGKAVWHSRLEEARQWAQQNRLHRGLHPGRHKSIKHFSSIHQHHGWVFYWGILRDKYIRLYGA